MAKKSSPPIMQIEEKVEETAKKQWLKIDRYRRKNEDKILFAAFVVAIGAALIVNTIYIVNRMPAYLTNQPANRVALNPQTILKTSQMGNNGVFEVTISGVREDNTPDRAFPVGATDTVLIATVSIKNTTTSTKQLIPDSHIYVRSDDGVNYTSHPSSVLTSPLIFQEVAAGQTAKGQVAFAIPKSVTDPRLYIDPAWEDSSPIVYAVLR